MNPQKPNGFSLLIYSYSMIFILCFIVPHRSVAGNDLLLSRRSSAFTYVFRITNNEAGSIYKSMSTAVDESLFHTLVDSFLTDIGLQHELAPGHYLKACPVEGNLNVSITTVAPFDVFVQNNGGDLMVQVVDTSGSISDALVKVKNRSIRFDEKTMTFRIKEANRRGLLTVEHKGVAVFRSLERKQNNPLIKRATRKALYQTPVKYVWIPVSFIGYLPFDAVKSIRSGYSEGRIYYLKRLFHWKSFKHSKQGKVLKRRPNSVYMVFNKPKYLPGDSVLGKAYILDYKGSAYSETLACKLVNQGKEILIDSIKPLHAGAYAFAFKLVDSLNLVLDKNYSIYLRTGNIVAAQGAFKYEDYELKATKLEVRYDGTVQYKGKEFAIYIKGTDVNGLNLSDARLKVEAKTRNIRNYYSNRMFIPNTIWTKELLLEPVGETKLLVPDSIFPEANMEYTLHVELLTADNDKQTTQKNISYYFRRKEIMFAMENDSMLIRFLVNGEEVQQPAHYEIQDGFRNQILDGEMNVPGKIKLNPYYSSIIVRADSINATEYMHNYASNVQFASHRTSDSLFVHSVNPLGLTFSYQLYESDRQIERGHGKALELKKKAEAKKTYHLSVQYLWSGKVTEQNYSFAPIGNGVLQVNVKQPSLIFPGQKTTIEIEVKDQKGNPVQDVDLTAYSLTSKFEYKSPVLNQYTERAKPRTEVNQFTLKEKKVNDSRTLLNYPFWNQLACLDSIEYYRFLYPGGQFYSYRYPAREGITQFSPFVVDSGRILPIHVVYVDKRPVYFSWSNASEPYSFRVDQGYHNIELRSTNATFNIDSMYFEPGMKTIFSFDRNVAFLNVRVFETAEFLSSKEMKSLYPYIFSYRINPRRNFTTLQQYNRYFLLHSPSINDRNGLFGPVTNWDMEYKEYNNFSRKFTFEPFFEYDFDKDLLIMRAADTIKRFPKSLGWLSQKPFHEQVHTSASLDSVYRKMNETQVMSNESRVFNFYFHPNRAKQYNNLGKLALEYHNDMNNKQLYLMLIRYDNLNSLQIFHGKEKVLYNLEPANYRLMIFYPDSKYQLIDSIQVKADGTNYIFVEKPEMLLRDEFSQVAEELIMDMASNRRRSEANAIRSRDSIQKEYYQHYLIGQQRSRNAGDRDNTHKTIEGYVVDNDGNPLIGVTVMVKGTTFGCISDSTGYYSLQVPKGKQTLVISYLGYKTIEIPVGSENDLMVTLDEEVFNLQEVAVVGYGTVERKEMVGSVASVISSSLQGRVAGVDMQSSPMIRIRGINAQDSDNPPLIVLDGVPFSGDLSQLSPDLIASATVLKDAESTAIYGARGANGVLLITTKSSQGTFKKPDNGANFDASFYQSALNASSIRSNFSDYAYWQPSLVTNKQGKASFEVVFPDDVTRWQTIVLAMNDKKQSGHSNGLIKSYKPLMASLFLPRFLTVGDTAVFIGKTLNYLGDSVTVTTSFEVDNSLHFKKENRLLHVQIDSMTVVAQPGDSLKARYFMERSDGFRDGEERKIPVLPQGFEQVEGQFAVLDTDTTVHYYFPDSLGEVTLYARADLFEVIDEGVFHLMNYRYLCNEQMASKLKAMLARQQMYTSVGKEFSKKHKEATEKLIAMLQKNTNEKGMWGWWNKSETNWWMSVHVLESLQKARSMGYTVQLNPRSIIDDLIWQIEAEKHPTLLLDKLELLHQIDPSLNVQHFIEKVDTMNMLSLLNRFRCMELKQKTGMPFDISTMLKYKKETLYGNYYFSEDNDSVQYRRNFDELPTALTAYRILNTAGEEYAAQARKVRNYLLEKNKGGSWINTYHSSKVIESLLPSVKPVQKGEKPVFMELRGDVAAAIDSFPYQTTFIPGSQLTITKTGEFPVYLSATQRYWCSNPAQKGDDFSLRTYFSNSDSVLKAGVVVKLIVEVEVKNDAEYVAIEIPIPAGCSYESKPNSSWRCDHSEYYKNQVCIFKRKMGKGNYSFQIELIPRYTGVYTLNPAKVELMYFPTFNANNEIKKVAIVSGEEGNR